MALTACAPWRGDKSFDIEQVGVNQKVHHRLEVIRVGAADVRRYEDPVTLVPEASTVRGTCKPR